MTTSARKINSSQQTVRPGIFRVYIISLVVGVLTIPALLALYDNSYTKVLLATILCYLCLYPAARYLARNESGVPVFPLLCLSYALLFAIPVYVNHPAIKLISGLSYLDDRDVIAALLLSIVGVFMLQSGYYSLYGERLSRAIPVIDLHLNDKKAMAYCVIVGLLLPLVLVGRSVVPEFESSRFTAVFVLLENQQLVVIGILGWKVYSGLGTKWHRLMLYCIVGIAVSRGISSAFLEQAIIPIAILFATKWLYTKRLPILSIVSLVAIILFLSPTKGSFRERVWFDDSPSVSTTGSFFSTAFLWVDQSAQYWGETLRGNRGISESTSDVASRTDLIHQLAHIYSLTPKEVPFQYGSTYSYFGVAFIPRAIWSDKPKAGNANDFFAVAYGITTEEGIKRVTYGVSLIGEGYINFGLVGVMLVMALQGVVLVLLQHIFGGRRSGAGGQAIFLAFFVFFLNGIGSSAEIYFGNILQNLLCSCALLWWAREKPSVQRPPRGVFPAELSKELVHQA